MTDELGANQPSASEPSTTSELPETSEPATSELPPVNAIPMSGEVHASRSRRLGSLFARRATAWALCAVLALTVVGLSVALATSGSNVVRVDHFGPAYRFKPGPGDRFGAPGTFRPGGPRLSVNGGPAVPVRPAYLPS